MKLWKEFKAFISRGNVVDMAVGVAVASAFTAIVTAFTKGFISPLLALLSGEADLASMKTIIRPQLPDAAAVEAGAEIEQAEVAILWGAFLQAIIDFLIVALVLFLLLKVVSSLTNSAKKIASDTRAKLTDEDEKAAEAAAAAKEAEEEAAAKAAEEAAAAAAAAEAAAKAAEAEKQAERDRLAREEALLAEIRDLLKNK